MLPIRTEMCLTYKSVSDAFCDCSAYRPLTRLFHFSLTVRAGGKVGETCLGQSVRTLTIKVAYNICYPTLHRINPLKSDKHDFQLMLRSVLKIRIRLYRDTIDLRGMYARLTLIGDRVPGLPSACKISGVLTDIKCGSPTEKGSRGATYASI